MSPTRYQQGRDAEYRAANELADEDYCSGRFAGSHGDGDVVAWDRTMIRFIQVKTFRGQRVPSYAADIAELAAMTLPPNATAELWVRRVGQRGWHQQLVIQSTLEEHAPP